MTGTDDRQHRSILQRIADRAMLEKGLVPDSPVQALAELMGAREPLVELPGGSVAGHLGLAVKDYGHSTAPNRRSDYTALAS